MCSHGLEDFIAQAWSYVPQCAAALDLLRQALSAGNVCPS